jgi:hypothetical protein
MAGVMLVAVAAGTTAASLLGATATANAAPDQYVAVAVGRGNDQPPVVSIGGISVGTDEHQNGITAQTNCVNNGGAGCVLEASSKNGCAAAAANDAGEIEAATDPSLQVARNSAMSKLQSQQGAHVVVSGCTTPQQAPPFQPPRPVAPLPVSPPQAPKQGPTVSWNPILGGLQAHIADRSGVSSQCTYTTDNYNRNFALPANSTYDLKIVPAIPQFRNWNVTITCDNGTSTQATTYF